MIPIIKRGLGMHNYREHKMLLDDWDILKQKCVIMKVMSELSETLEATKKPMRSLVLPYTNRAIYKLQ